MIWLGQGQGGQANQWQQLIVLLLPLLIIMVVMQFFMGTSAAKEKKKRDEKIASMKKNDTVVTIGGIIGTFVSASEDRSEVTIKVDDNTRLKLQASAIRDVLPKKGESEAKDKT